jgi:excisionase family DNA binding protein
MSSPDIFTGEQVWCPYCKGYFRLLRVHGAAKLADVNRRTIYRYIEEGSVYTVKIAGKTYRICSGCLLKKDLAD